MAIHERNRFAATLHTIVALLLLLGGGGLLGVGIWLLASDRGGGIDLDYTGSNFWNFVLNFGIAAIIGGGFILLSALAALISISRKCIGKFFRIIYVLMALVIVAVLVFIAAVSFLILERRNSSGVEDFVRDAWVRSVTSQDKEVVDAVCDIQNRWDCVGFRNNDCTGCVRGNESGCQPNQLQVCPKCGVQRDASKGCYPEVSDRLRNVYLPLGIVTVVLAAIVFVDIFVVCCI